MDPFSAVALGAGAIKGITGLIQGFSAGRQAKKINPVYSLYKTSKYAKDTLGDAQSKVNARDFGAGALYNNIQTNAQGAFNNIQRSALTPASALAAAASVQGQTNQALFQQQAQEAQNFAMRQARLDQARQGMVDEGRMENASINQKYEMDMSQKNALENKRDQSFMNGIGAIADGAATGAFMKSSGMFGKAGGMAGKSSPLGLQSVGSFTGRSAAGMNPVVGNMSWAGKNTGKTRMATSNNSTNFMYP